MGEVGLIAVSRVPAPISPEVWATCEPWIEAALDVAGAWRTEDVRGWIEDRHWTLWLVTADDRPVACATTELGHFPRLRVLHLSLVAGAGLNEYVEPLFSAVDAYAHELGCSRVMCSYARRGWIPTLKPLGWMPRATVIAKDL